MYRTGDREALTEAALRSALLEVSLLPAGAPRPALPDARERARAAPRYGPDCPNGFEAAPTGAEPRAQRELGPRPMAASTSSLCAARYSSTSRPSSARSRSTPSYTNWNAWRCSSPRSSNDRRSTAAENSFSSRVFARATATLAPVRAAALGTLRRRVGHDEEGAEEPFALAARGDALHTDEREVDLPPLARADGSD